MEKERSVSNAGLHDWGMGDRPGREDFNSNRRILEEAIAGKCALVTGMYTGNGAPARKIMLGFVPRALIVKNPNNSGTFFHTEEVCYAPVVVLPGLEGKLVTITEDGFTVTSHGLVNGENYQYVYLALQ